MIYSFEFYSFDLSILIFFFLSPSPVSLLHLGNLSQSSFEYFFFLLPIVPFYYCLIFLSYLLSSIFVPPLTLPTYILLLPRRIHIIISICLFSFASLWILIYLVSSLQIPYQAIYTNSATANLSLSFRLGAH